VNTIQYLCRMKGVLAMATLLVSMACKSEDLAKPVAPLATHCMPTETNYFSCRIQGTQKVASLCGRPVNELPADEVAPDLGLEYRFGRIAQVEFRFPSDRTRPAQKFFGEHLQPYGEGVSIDSVLFESGDASYAVLVREGRSKFIGVSVAIGKKYRELPCDTSANVSSFFSLVLTLPPPK